MSRFTSEQERGFEGLMGDVLAKVDRKFSDLDKTMQAKFVDAGRDVARLSDRVEDLKVDYRDRFKVAQQGVYERGGPSRFRSADDARQFAKLIRGVINNDLPAIREAQRAAIDGSSGAAGGFLAPDTLVSGIIRDVEKYGVLERNATVRQVASQTGAEARRTAGPTVYYPDYGVAPTQSQMTFGRVNFGLTRHASFVLVDRWMMRDELAVSLAEYVAEELAWAIAYATDLNGFVGDGSSTYAKTTGLFKRAGDQLVVTADTGDDTFAEVTAASTKYLSKVIGTLPDWADLGAKWFLHRSIFWDFLGIRDSQNRPVADIMVNAGTPQKVLMGYPVETVQVAPKLSETAVSKVMAIFGDLMRAWRIFRHVTGVEVRRSEHYKFLEGQEAVAIDVLQDQAEANSQGYVQLKTAAS